MVEYLLSLPKVDPSASTSMDGSEEGNTGLHIAAIHDSPDIADLLIRRGCPTKAINGEVKLVIGILVRVCVTNLHVKSDITNSQLIEVIGLSESCLLLKTFNYKFRSLLLFTLTIRILRFM